MKTKQIKPLHTFTPLTFEKKNLNLTWHKSYERMTTFIVKYVTNSMVRTRYWAGRIIKWDLVLITYINDHM